jgi:anti-sigma-K factor RskA
MSEMDHGTDHDRWPDEIAAYALGALEPAETAAVERHLEHCERCQAGLRWTMPAINAMPEAVEQFEPPASLRAKLIGEAKRNATEEARRARSGGWLQRLGGALRGDGSHPFLRPAAGLAAVLLIAVAAGYAIGIGGSGDSGGGGTVVASEPSGIVAKVVRDGAEDGGTLRLANVAPLHDDHVLEAWVQRGKRVMPVRALFVPDDKGRATTMLPDMKNVSAVMVTVEPRGGSESPTSTPIATVPIPG